MSTKNQALKKRKLAKVKARSAQIQKKKYHEKLVLAKAMKSGEQLAREVAKDGIMSVSERLYKIRRKAKEKPTDLGTKEVLESINEVVPVVGLIHGGVEIATILASEGKLVISDEQKAHVDEYDRQVVAISEDVKAIIELIEANKEPIEYMDLYIHYVDLIALMMLGSITSIRTELLVPNEELITQYVDEHKLENENNVDIGMRYHEQRMKVVFPLYSNKMGGTDTPLDEPKEEQVQPAELTEPAAPETITEQPA